MDDEHSAEYINAILELKPTYRDLRQQVRKLKNNSALKVEKLSRLQVLFSIYWTT